MTTALNLSQLLLNENEQLAFAARVASAIEQTESRGVIIFLKGDLGAGKTTFVRGFLHALGHNGVVKSPTYTLVEPYQLKHRNIYHFDLYRLADPEELEYAGGRDYFDSESICLLEWPEKAAGFLPRADLEIDLSYAGEGRHLVLQAGTDTGKNIMLALLSD